MTDSQSPKIKSQGNKQSLLEDTTRLTNQFLIAMPGMADPNFAGSVIYLCEHGDQGAMGLVINRPTDIDLASLFDKIDLKLEIQTLKEEPVYFGGPVQTDRGFVLHEQTEASHYSSSLKIPNGLAMTTSKDVLEQVAHGQGPKRFIMTLGYAGWSAGQLEEELSLNGWLNVPASSDKIADIIFETPDADKYDKVIGLLGIDPHFLSGEAGHA